MEGKTVDITQQQKRVVGEIVYSCYNDGGQPGVLEDHVLSFLGITVEGKELRLLCNSEDHIPGGRVYERLWKPRFLTSETNWGGKDG